MVNKYVNFAENSMNFVKIWQRFAENQQYFFTMRPIWPQITHLVSEASNLSSGPFFIRVKLLDGLNQNNLGRGP